MYKLRVYAKDGSLDHEEFFNTKVLMDTRYNELFRYDLYSLNPTAWENVNNGWRRIAGYQFDIEQEGVIMWFESEPSKAYKGKLEGSRKYVRNSWKILRQFI